MVVVGICLAGRSSMFQTLWSQVLTPKVAILESGYAEILDKNSQIMSFICPSEKAIPRAEILQVFLTSIHCICSWLEPTLLSQTSFPCMARCPSLTVEVCPRQRGTETGYLHFLRFLSWVVAMVSSTAISETVAKGQDLGYRITAANANSGVREPQDCFWRLTWKPGSTALKMPVPFKGVILSRILS